MISAKSEKQNDLSTLFDKLIEILRQYRKTRIREHIEKAWQLPSSLLEYLPPPYRQGEFLNRFLAPFEKILLGREDCLDLDEDTGVEYLNSTLNPKYKCQSLEYRIKNLHQVFTPKPTKPDQQGAPKEFLEWLSDWTGFLLRGDLEEEDQREFLADIVQLYKKRGTKKNLEDLLEKFTGLVPRVEEFLTEGFQIGKTSTIGDNTIIGGYAPYFFTVTIAMERKQEGAEETERVNRIRSIANPLIELQKPAHTQFKLKIDYPTMCIGLHSTIGVDTILGTHDECKLERKDE